jgi:hypothetical protein
LREVIGAYWTSGSYPGDAIPNGPPDLAEPTIRLARSKGWKVSFRQDNPKKAGSASWTRYENYKASVTLQEAIDKGAMYGKQNGSGDDLNFDWKHGFLKLHDPSIECSNSEPGELTDDSDGLVYEEWAAARLVLLPKKGDLSLCKNWRGICLLDVCSKILSSMLVRRLQIVMEECGMQAQTGFSDQRVTID